MAHQLRYVPTDSSGWGVVEVTVRIVNGFFLLAPSSHLRDLLIGIIGRAQRKTEIRIHALDYQVNHAHLLLGARDAQQLADFMRRIQHQTSVELRILRGWKGPKWEGPYKTSFPGHAKKDLCRRFRYILAQGCKAGLVSSPRKWPGVSVGEALWSGTFELEGTWVDRSALRRARFSKAGRRLSEKDFSSRETVVLSKLPCFEDLPDEEYFDWARGMIVEIEDETRVRHKRKGTRPRGAYKTTQVSPMRRPRKLDWGPRPRVIASDSYERNRLLSVFDAVRRAHRAARDLLWGGDPEAKFPPGTFPSPLPFVALEVAGPGARDGP